MSISNYIERQLVRKSLGTYFRKGKWVLHVLFVIIFWFTYCLKYLGDISHWRPGGIALAGSLILPFVIFFYGYCLYLIPFCFKRNRYRKFWLLLAAMLAVFPLIDHLCLHWAARGLPGLRKKLDNDGTWLPLLKTYFNFTTSFFGFTAFLYFMELLEGIHTHKETDRNQVQLAATELHRIKTQMNPDFMIRSLEGIIQLEAQDSEWAPGSVIDFSDVLRYRLYRSKERLVTLKEELSQLANLCRLHNALPGQENTVTLETEGDDEASVLVPLSLINIAEPLLTTFREGKTWSLLLYLLIEEKEIQLAAELSTDDEDLDARLQSIGQDMERLLYSGLTFTVEKEQNTYSIRTCIPIFRNSTVSS